MTLLKNNNSGYAGKLLVLIFLLAAFLRFFRLSDYPVHLGHDEVSQLYDAISISETGKDIYRNNLPLFLSRLMILNLLSTLMLLFLLTNFLVGRM